MDSNKTFDSKKKPPTNEEQAKFFAEQFTGDSETDRKTEFLQNVGQVFDLTMTGVLFRHIYKTEEDQQEVFDTVWQVVDKMFKDKHKAQKEQLKRMKDTVAGALLGSLMPDGEEVDKELEEFLKDSKAYLKLLMMPDTFKKENNL